MEMPNIVMYGFLKSMAREVEGTIRTLFAGKSYGKDCVTTYIESDVRDSDNLPAPFLLLAVTNECPVDDIIVELQKLNYDIEVKVLARFIPRKI